MKADYKQDIAFECGVCADDKPARSPRVELAGDSVCKVCYLETIKPLFHKAIDDISQCAVHWASDELSPEQLPGFTQAFKKQWVARVEVFKLPREQRVYCRHLAIHNPHDKSWRAAGQIVYEKARREGTSARECGQLVGGATIGTGLSTEKCKRCQGTMCMHCGLALYPLLRTGSHECDPENLKQRPDIDPSLVRGVDYQICPNEKCGKKWGLGDGCNAMVCESCRTHFCFICGAKAHHDSDHYQKSCPRWNQPGTARAHHDVVEEPLVIDPNIIRIATQARAAAATAESEILRQAKLDEAVAAELLGEIEARSIRAQEAHMEGVIWNQNWYNAAEDAVDACLDGLPLYAHLDTLSDPSKLAELHRKHVLRILDDDRKFRWQEEHVILGFLDDHPAEADLLGGGEMRALIERVTKLAADVQEMARKWLAEHPDDKVPALSKSGL